MTIAKRRIGRGWLLAAAGAAIVGMFAVGAAFAVHDQGFQLEGNATASNIHHGAVTVDPDGHGPIPPVSAARSGTETSPSERMRYRLRSKTPAARYTAGGRGTSGPRCLRPGR